MSMKCWLEIQKKIEQFKPIMDSVSAMAELHKILEDMRERRGALNFDTSEARILVNDKECQLISWCVNVGRLSE